MDRGCSVLTHGFQLPDELLFRPFRPLLLVGVDGAEDGAAGLPAVLDGWDVQVVHQDDVGVLQGEYRDGQHEGGTEPIQGDVPPAGADRPSVPTPGFLILGTADFWNEILLWRRAALGTGFRPREASKPCPLPRCDNQECLQPLPTVPRGTKSPPAANHKG